MKKLKFSEPLTKLILNGKKNTTWRINDDKNISVDDLISLCYNDGKEFAQAKVVQVKETNFRSLTKEDREGHEEFSSDSEMYQTYSEYYKMKVIPETKVKVIKFKLLQML
jgi:hypothetical protein